MSTRSFVLLAAAAGLAIVLQQLIELLPAITRTELGEGAQRMRLVVELGGRGASLVTGDVLLVGAVLGLAHRTGTRTLGVIHLAGGALVLLLIPLFLLDANNLAGAYGANTLAPEARTFGVLIVRATVLMLGLGGISVIAGRHLLRVGATLPPAAIGPPPA